MYAVINLSQGTQRTICMLMSAVIVTACLTLGAFGMQSMLHDGFSVTVTQLQ